MTSFIVSNRSDFRSFKEPADDLIIVHQYSTPIYTTALPSYSDKYDVYYPTGTNIPENIKEYINQSNLAIDVDDFDIPYRALDQIYDKITTDENDEYDSNSSLVIVSDFNFSKLAESYFKRKNREFNRNVGIMNMIKYMNLTSFDALVNQIKERLGVSDIYPNDLITFSYAVSQSISWR